MKYLIAGLAVAVLALGQTGTKVAGGSGTAKRKAQKVGIVLPVVQLGPQQTAEQTEGVRKILIEHLTGPGIELIPLSARIPQQIKAEAEEKGCAFVITSEFTLAATKGSAFGKIMRAAQPVAGMAPMVGMAGAAGGATTAVATTAAVTAAAAIAGASANVKAKDALTLTYRLNNGDKVVANQTIKRTAKNDGEDIITPIINQAATEIVGVVLQ